MAYGTAAGPGDIERYYTDIRGRAPTPEHLQELTERYAAIGNRFPLLEITRQQASALERELNSAHPGAFRTYLGMKHSAPFVAEGVAEMRADGIDRAVGLVLAPHFSRMSLGAYEARLREAWGDGLVFIPGFHDHPAFIGAVRGLLQEALEGYPADHLFFTAHSLPERILADGDPYRDQLQETCRLVAAEACLPPWELAFQSRSTTGEPWLGPDILEALAASGARRALVCPVGFVADHLEILYDLDVETQAFARRRGIEVRRTASFNDRTEFVDALAAVVSDFLSP